jgi:hypothetical protein
VGEAGIGRFCAILPTQFSRLNSAILDNTRFIGWRLKCTWILAMVGFPKVMWSQAADICAITETNGHLGLAVKTEMGWIAFTSANVSNGERGLNELGTFPNMADAKTAVERALSLARLSHPENVPKRIVTACPICSSTALKTKRARGFERLMIRLTGKRKYACTNCGSSFRALDRRRTARNDT